MEAECSGTDTGYGVELDWMRAFGNYRTDAGGAPSVADIMGQIDAAHDDPDFEHTDAYDFLLDAATGDGFGPRMSTIWDTHGANH
jgi:hypothetical protein